MKIRFCRSIFIIAAVIFFIACGIPSYFYLGSGGADYSISTENKTDSGIDVYYSMDDSNQVGKISLGPGILFLYTICDSDTQNFFGSPGTYSSTLNSTFNTEYKANNYVTGKGWVPTEKTALDDAYTDAGESTGYFQDGYSRSFNLYPFYDSDSVKFSTPVYEYNPDNPSEILQEIKIKLHVEGNVVEIETPDGTKELTRYEGKSFGAIRRAVDDRSSDLDLFGVKGVNFAADDPLYLHVYTAMTAGTGKFSNIYWTNLYYLGCYKLSTIE